MASKKKKTKKKKKMSKTVRKIPKYVKAPSEMTMQAMLRGGGGPHKDKREKRANNKKNKWKEDDWGDS